mmetsp:Transcript_23916/g.74103  ORF Transcript_23916/g.74103 Transcript_23916/m.74103 type:complete len:268 (-) Transcript_23916:1986-2789(-)
MPTKRAFMMCGRVRTMFIMSATSLDGRDWNETLIDTRFGNDSMIDLRMPAHSRLALPRRTVCMTSEFTRALIASGMPSSFTKTGGSAPAHHSSLSVMVLPRRPFRSSKRTPSGAGRTTTGPPCVMHGGLAVAICGGTVVVGGGGGGERTPSGCAGGTYGYSTATLLKLTRRIARQPSRALPRSFTAASESKTHPAMDSISSRVALCSSRPSVATSLPVRRLPSRMISRSSVTARSPSSNAAKKAPRLAMPDASARIAFCSSRVTHRS